MEFTYRVSENDYLRAWKAAAKANRLEGWKRVLFWVFIVVCLMLFFGVVARQTHSHDAKGQNPFDSDSQSAPEPHSTTTLTRALVVNVLPFSIIVACWGVIVSIWIPQSVRRRYRKDPNQQGEITAKLDPQSFEIRSSSGSTLRTNWNVFKDWRKVNGLILLRYPSGISQILVTSGLNDDERSELRSILAHALPGK